jgi:hypothetical protein
MKRICFATTAPKLVAPGYAVGAKIYRIDFKK